MKSDSNGFVIADSSLDAGELTRGITGIKRDTSAILSLMKRSGKESVMQRARVTSRAASTGSRSSTSYPASPGGSGGDRTRDPVTGRFVSGKTAAKPVEELAKAVKAMTKQQAAQAAVDARSDAARKSRTGENKQPGTSDQARDARGRFGSGGGDGGGESDKKESRLLSALKSALPGAGGGAGDMEKIDPAIEAANEISRIVGSPLKAVGDLGKAVIGRGFSPNGADKPVRWYRRMWAELRGTRKDQKEFSKAETKAIKEIEPGGGGDGGGLISSIMKTLFSPIGVAIVAAIAPALVTIGDKIVAKWNDVWTPFSSWLKGPSRGGLGTAAARLDDA